MCHLVRDSSAAGADEPRASSSPPFGRLRPRWIAAIAAALVGGVAVAALVAAPARPTVTAAVSPPAQRGGPMSIPVVDRAALPADDGVPDAPQVARAGAGAEPCHHGGM